MFHKVEIIALWHSYCWLVSKIIVRCYWLHGFLRLCTNIHTKRKSSDTIVNSDRILNVLPDRMNKFKIKRMEIFRQNRWLNTHSTCYTFLCSLNWNKSNWIAQRLNYCKPSIEMDLSKDYRKILLWAILRIYNKNRKLKWIKFALLKVKMRTTQWRNFILAIAIQQNTVAPTHTNRIMFMFSIFFWTIKKIIYFELHEQEKCNQQWATNSRWNKERWFTIQSINLSNNFSSFS